MILHEVYFLANIHINQNKINNPLGKYNRMPIFAIQFKNGLVAQLNRAFDYGSKGFRFES